MTSTLRLKFLLLFILIPATLLSATGAHYLLTNTSLFTGLWAMDTTNATPSTDTKTSILCNIIPAGNFYVFYPGTASRTTFSPSQPLTFSQNGWRSQSLINNTLTSGNFIVSLVVKNTNNQALAGTLWARFWKSNSASGTQAVSLTAWTSSPNTITFPNAAATASDSFLVPVTQTLFAGEYLFVEFGWQISTAGAAGSGVVLVSDQATGESVDLPNWINTPTPTPSVTPSATRTATPTPTPTATRSATITHTSTITPSATLSPTFTISPTISPTATTSPSFTISDTFTFSPTPSVMESLTSTETATPTLTPSPVLSPTPTPQPVIVLPAAASDMLLGKNVFDPSKAPLPISLKLAEGGQLKVEVFASNGERLRLLLNESRPAGSVLLYWDGRRDSGTLVGADLYFIRAIVDGKAVTRKVLLLNGIGP